MASDRRRELYSRQFFGGLCVAFAGLVLWYLVRANLDLTGGRFALFMDERLTFDGVKAILHPNGMQEFVYAILDGRDQRYGRILWYLSAVLAAVPERLYDDTGQIIATRMSLFLFLSLSYLTIAFGILRSWLLRFVLLVAMLFLPYSDYYMTMPKPEPIQFLLLSLFLLDFIRTGGTSTYSWMFAGMAFGAKISALPALLVLACFSIASQRSSLGSAALDALLRSGVMFLIGLAIGVPILSPAIVLLLGLWILVGSASQRLSIPLLVRGGLYAASGAAAYLAFRPYVDRWMKETILNTGHITDQSDITPLTWLRYFFDTWLAAPNFLSIALVALVIVYVGISLLELVASGRLRFDRTSASIAVLLAGVGWLLAIAFGTKRLWGFYLYPGMLLTLVGFLALLDEHAPGSERWDRKPLRVAKYLAGYSSLFLLLVMVLGFWLPATLGGYEAKASRTKSVDYQNDLASYRLYLEFLEAQSASQRKRLRVLHSPNLFPPLNDGQFESVEFWGFNLDFSDKYDVLLLSREDTPRGTPVPASSVSYADFLGIRSDYAAHVAQASARCSDSPCFRRALELPNGGEVLVLQGAQ